MMHISGPDRSQTLLLPEPLDEYVGQENPVRFIDAFVDGLDLAAAGFGRVQPKMTGRPGYAPKDLLKLYIYGYLNRVRSSRRLKAENKLVYDDCAIRSRCTGGEFRTVSRLENEAVLDRMQARLTKRPDVLDRRRGTVEHPFGTIKQWMNQGAFLMRGLEKVRAEFSLTALAYNLRLLLNIVLTVDVAGIAPWRADAANPPDA